MNDRRNLVLNPFDLLWHLLAIIFKRGRGRFHQRFEERGGGRLTGDVISATIKSGDHALPKRQGGRLMFNVSPTIPNSWFRKILPGIETLASNFSLPRHRHLRAYATVVLAGTFEESGYNGRIRATTGDVLIHPALDCHGNQMVSAGVKLIRLHWADDSERGGLYHIDDVDEIARAAEKDVPEATYLLKRALSEQGRPSHGQKNDWPDMLLTDLTNNVSIEFGVWAELNGLARETVSRRFTAAYGIAPSVLRGELRARSAWLRITKGSEDLCGIALDTGFADQAHMTRWIHRITGAPPAAWRKHSPAAHRP